MDGVITNTMPYHFDAWMLVFDSIGIKVNCFDIYKREGQDGLSTLKEIFKEKGMKFNIKNARLLLRKKEELFKASAKIRFVNGSRPFLRGLKKKDFVLALVTGTSRHEMERILPVALRRLFDLTVTGDEVKKGKPHPEPFLRAVSKLKLSSKEVLVIENAPFGITSAKKAGLFCIALETSLPARYLKGADKIVKNFKELKEFLRKKY